MDAFFRKFIWSIAISILVYEFFHFLYSHPTISTSFIAFIGALFSFLIFQIFQFFINKFLERNLKFNEFDYVKNGFSIIFPYLFSVFITSMLLIVDISFYSIKIQEINSIPVITIIDSYAFWIFFLNIFIIFLRTGKIKKQFIELQNKNER